MEASARETIRFREVGRLMGGLRRIRAIVLSVGIAVLLWLIVARHISFSSLTWAWLTVFVVPIVLVDVYRVWRTPQVRPASVAVDLWLGALGQTAVISLTGGVESPLLFVYIALPISAAASLGPGRAAYSVLVAVLALPWLVFAGSLLGVVPRALPELLSLEPGFAHQLPYAATRVATVNLASIIMFRLGRLIFHTINRMLDQALDARRAALDAQLERNRELVELSSAIAHELKNPLASVKGLVQLIERGGKNAAQRFEVLNQQIDRTRDILDEFLNFARPVGPLAIEPVELSSMLADIALLHEGLAEERSVTIRAGPLESVEVAGDRRKLEQAIINLLQNAIEASPHAGEVQCILRQTNEAVFVGVRDHGPGMDASIREHGPRVGLTTKPRGSGIGLAMARTIAEQHGGRLGIAHPDDGGCEVGLTIPKERS